MELERKGITMIMRAFQCVSLLLIVFAATTSHSAEAKLNSPPDGFKLLFNG